MSTEKEIEDKKKLTEEIKAEFKETHVPKEDYDKLKNMTFKVPISCPGCGEKMEAEVRRKGSKEKKPDKKE